MDLLGSFGELGQITSVPTFHLSAGATYTLSYGVLVQGVSSGTESYSVRLGGITQMETATPSVQDESLTFTPISSKSGATLVFTQLTALNLVNGAIMDNIVLTEDAAPTSGAPEPSSLAMIFGGLGALGALRRFSRARHATRTV